MAALNLISLSLFLFFSRECSRFVCISSTSEQRTSLLKGNAPYSNRLESEAHFLKKRFDIFESV